MKKLISKIGLSIKISITIFLILCLAAAISGVIMHVAMRLGIYTESINGIGIPVVSLLSCIVIGTLLASVASSHTVKAVEKFVRASNQVANGDFTARVEVRGPYEFKVMADNFNHMAQELGSIEVLRSDFINDFSHEFKTPIVSIKGFAEILKYGDLSEEERSEYLDIVIEESARLSTLATNILAVSKIEKQGILTNQQTFNLGEQIRQCILLLDNKINEKEITLILNIQDYMTYGNKDMMSQVWLNLLDNAIKFTNIKGLIKLSMIRKDGWVEIEIANTGKGISKQALPRIFDKFYQGDTSHDTKGNGLGLAMVKKIIELHEGDISCESAIDQGTMFTVRLLEK